MAVRAKSGSSDDTFYLAKEVCDEGGFKVGHIVDYSQLFDLQSRSEELLALRRGLSLVARTMHSHRGLSLKLRRSGFSEEPILLALERIGKLGYINDKEFAHLWARTRVERSVDSRVKVLFGLLQRGISKDIAEIALENEYSLEQEIHVCVKVARQLLKQQSRRGLNRDRIARQLSQKGFRNQQIVQVLRGLWSDEAVLPQ